MSTQRKAENPQSPPPFQKGDRVVVTGGGWRIMGNEYEEALPDEAWFRVLWVGAETLTVVSPGSLSAFKILLEQARPYSGPGDGKQVGPTRFPKEAIGCFTRKESYLRARL